MEGKKKRKNRGEETGRRLGEKGREKEGAGGIF